MNVSALEESVINLVQDVSYEGRILPFLNQGLNWIAARFKLASLDSLDTVDALSTSDNVALPSNYMHDVYWVGKDGKQIGSIPYYYSFQHFQKKHPDLSIQSEITDVAINGTKIYYSGRENAVLNIRFFEAPTQLTTQGDEPLCLPDYLHELLLANYAAWKIYDQIEDGIEDPKTNTKYYQSLFFGYLSDLEMFTIDTEQPTYVEEASDRI